MIKKRLILSICLSALILLMTNGCKDDVKPIIKLTKIRPQNYPEFTDDIDFQRLETAIDKSLVYLSRFREN